MSVNWQDRAQSAEARALSLEAQVEGLNSAMEQDLREPIFKAIRRHTMSNMGDGDGNGYPLVDLMSNPGPSTIETGEEEMRILADEVSEAVGAALASLPQGDQGASLAESAAVSDGWQDISTAPKDGAAVLLTVADAYTPTVFMAWWLDGREGEGFYTYTRPGEKQDVGGFHRMVCPTHWRPIPSPPQTPVSGDGR